ncbi:MAG: hypothetical protein U0V48_08825 [Anaerolineales bacterium]
MSSGKGIHGGIRPTSDLEADGDDVQQSIPAIRSVDDRNSTSGEAIQLTNSMLGELSRE